MDALDLVLPIASLLKPQWTFLDCVRAQFIPPDLQCLIKACDDVSGDVRNQHTLSVRNTFLITKNTIIVLLPHVNVLRSLLLICFEFVLGSCASDLLLLVSSLLSIAFLLIGRVVGNVGQTFVIVVNWCLLVLATFLLGTAIPVERLVLEALEMKDLTGLQVDHASTMSIHKDNKRIRVHVKVEIWLHEIAYVDLVDTLGVKM